MGGVDVFELSPLRRSALERLKQAERETRFIEILVIVQALQDVVRAVLGANANSKLQDTLKVLRDMVFPEWAEEDQTAAKKKEELLKREFSSGPIKLQSTSYEPEKKRRTGKSVRKKPVQDPQQRR